MRSFTPGNASYLNTPSAIPASIILGKAWNTRCSMSARASGPSTSTLFAVRSALTFAVSVFPAKEHPCFEIGLPTTSLTACSSGPPAMPDLCAERVIVSSLCERSVSTQQLEQQQFNRMVIKGTTQRHRPTSGRKGCPHVPENQQPTVATTLVARRRTPSDDR